MNIHSSNMVVTGERSTGCLSLSKYTDIQNQIQTSILNLKALCGERFIKIKNTTINKYCSCRINCQLQQSHNKSVNTWILWENPFCYDRYFCFLFKLHSVHLCPGFLDRKVYTHFFYKRFVPVLLQVYFPARGWMCVDATDPMSGNWLRYVNWARSSEEQNLFPLEINRAIYYKVLRVS